jgi:acyl-CoA synthetase (AMP-forming)/AMP-acid ligase II
MVAWWLRERLTEWPERPALIWRDRSVPYGALVDGIGAWTRRLDDAGVRPGSVVALESDYTPEAVSLLLALVERAAVVVPLSSVTPAEREEFIATAEVEVVVTPGADEGARIVHRAVAVEHPLLRRLLDAGEPGLVLFSSGATGKNKAALHSFTPLLEKYQVRRHAMRTMSFLLLDHIGGINTLFHTLSNGGTVVSVEARDPDTVCAAVARHRVQLLPTSPTFLNLMLLSEAWRRHDLSSLELVTYGTEVMPHSTLERLRTALPNVRLLQTYGLSEVGILRSQSRESGSLWLRVGGEGFETKVVDGVLWIRARSAMLGYLNAPSPFDAEGWLNTQDMVEVDGDWIHILGRKTDIVNVGGQKVYPAEVESTLLQMPNVRDVAVFGESNPITGQIVVARLNLWEPEPLAELRRRVRAFCRDRLAAYKVPARIEITQREQFSARFKKMRKPAQTV